MSVEDLKKYGQLCVEQEDIRTKAKAIGLENVDGHIAYAKELGLTFTQEDMVALAQEAGIEKSEELSEADLEKVAGGVVTTTAAVVGVCVVGGLAAAGAAALTVGGLSAAISKAW